MSLAAALVGAIVLGILIPRQGADLPERPCAPTTRILVAAGPIHTDIVLPATPEFLARFAFLRDVGLPLDHPGVRSIVLGWGGRSFYIGTPTWRDVDLGTVVRSFGADRSVMHVSLTGAYEEGDPAVRVFELQPDAVEAMVKAIEAEFERDVDGRPILIPGVGYTPFDRFFEAKDTFNALFGCNTFTAAVLRAGGVDTGFWTPLPQALYLSMTLHGRESQPVEHPAAASPH
ncbi:TIGR02117 family protein [Mangrovicella endophytica]|uniref:TIGR02117 family protein n=1 Tax=Mangrovicella endophytica TaxID=2066697 RepID=UPI000C9E995C|nr:TIGR02117 family protein [Mangrovicella endophytica]